MTTLLKTSLAVLVAGFTVLSASAQGRIATVDLAKVLDRYWKTKQAEAALKERGADLEKELKGMVEDNKKNIEEYQQLLNAANDQAVSAEEREKRKQNAEKKLRELRDLQETIAQFERQARVTLDEQRTRMLNNLIEEIRATVNSKARSAGYALVLDTSALTPKATPVILYNSGDNDLTEAVVQQLNLTAPPDATKPASKQ